MKNYCMKTFKIFVLILVASLGLALLPGLDALDRNSTNADWLTMEEAQKKASVDGKPLFVFIEAEWCGICRQMLKNIFPEEEISEKLTEKYHPVLIDLDSKKQILFNEDKMTEREFARKMEVVATPTTLFFDSDGIELGRQLGGMDKKQIIRLMAYVASDQFFEVTLDEFEMDG